MLAARVLAAGAGLPTYVACDDEYVATWARERGAEVCWTPGLGLSGAVTAAVQELALAGLEHVVVAHSDLPLVESLADFGTPGAVTIAPDRGFQGTNVIAVPSVSGFGFSYGPGSFDRHRDEARRLGLSCRIVHDRRLAADVDDPSDLDLLQPGFAPWS